VTARPGDPQARTGLQRCVRALRSISAEWAGAARAIELFGRARIASAQDDEAQAEHRVKNPESMLQNNKRVASYEAEALTTAPSGQNQNVGHGWPSTNDMGEVQQEQKAPGSSATSTSVNVPYNPTNSRQHPPSSMQPPYSYQPSQSLHHIPKSTAYPPPGLYRAEKAMDILAANASANDSFYRLHPQSSSRTSLDLDVRSSNPQYQQQPQQSGSTFDHNPYGEAGDNNSNTIPSWQSTTGVQHSDLAAIDSAVHDAYLAEPPLSMAALPHLYHNTGIVDQSGLEFLHTHAHAQQQQGQGQYAHLPQQHYAQHPSSLALGGASMRRTQYAHGAAELFPAFENYDSSYVPQANIIGQQPPPQPPQAQDGVYPPEQGYGMYGESSSLHEMWSNIITKYLRR
jgi:hypothetical protein